MMKLIVDENLLSFKVLEQKIFDYVCELSMPDYPADSGSL